MSDGAGADMGAASAELVVAGALVAAGGGADGAGIVAAGAAGSVSRLVVGVALCILESNRPCICMHGVESFPRSCVALVK